MTVLGEEKNMGENKIAYVLNFRGLKTKRGCTWSQNAIARILSNELYIGKIVNGKETVENFLTSKRSTVPENEWLVTARPGLRIIDENVFEKVKKNIVKRDMMLLF